jgi:phosphoglycerate dehydrogenase-like enzyme
VCARKIRRPKKSLIIMSIDVLCLRPLSDFESVGVVPPAALQVAYRGPADGDIPDLMKQARALVIPAVGPRLPAVLFQDGSRVRFVQVTGAGLDRLDLEILRQQKIVVSNVPGGSNAALAEYALTTASVLLRRFAWADQEIRKGNYAAFRARMMADNLQAIDGLLVGIVGFGTIGRAVADAFRQHRCRICFYDPAPVDVETTWAIDAQAVTLDELLASADVVTLHVPLLPATRGLIGSRELAAMKPGAILIQASRGGVVDESALADSLRSGHLGGAAVDVYTNEPPVTDNPLLNLEGDAASRVFFTPHVAGVTRQSAAFLFRAAWQNVERVLIANEAPLNRVF